MENKSGSNVTGLEQHTDGVSTCPHCGKSWEDPDKVRMLRELGAATFRIQEKMNSLREKDMKIISLGEKVFELENNPNSSASLTHLQDKLLNVMAELDRYKAANKRLEELAKGISNLRNRMIGLDIMLVKRDQSGLMVDQGELADKLFDLLDLFVFTA